MTVCLRFAFLQYPPYLVAGGPTKGLGPIMAPWLKILQWLHFDLEINFRLFSRNYKALWIPLSLVRVASFLVVTWAQRTLAKAVFLFTYTCISNLCARSLTSACLFESFHMPLSLPGTLCLVNCSAFWSQP